MAVPSPLDRLREVPLGRGQAAISWLGQAGFIPAEARGVDVVLCSHGHVDHFDAESVRRTPTGGSTSRCCPSTVAIRSARPGGSWGT